MRGVSKTYGPVVACDSVDLVVRRGEIHGLLGENGAGKSTLMKILLGLVTPDRGEISLDGEPVRTLDPQRAAERRIGMVHQHFSLVGPLTVWENVVLGDRGRIDRVAACASVLEVAETYGLPIDPMARVDRLSAGERQRVELIKCLRRDPSILILDEPTSVLTQAESAELFAVLRRVVRDEDRAVILISHKLAEIVDATDEVTVLRRGRVVFHRATAATSAGELARQMVGREVSLTAEAAALGLVPTSRSAATGVDSRQPALQLRDVTVELDGVRSLDRLSLEVHPGEILGLYGVEGNGQTALVDVLSGLADLATGSVEIDGTPVDLARSGALTAAGLGLIPEDRHRTGVVLDLSVAENLVLKSLPTVSRRGRLDKARIAELAQRLVAEFEISTPSIHTPVRHLSGGNQQRVVLARELSRDPRVLVAAQPTQGLDIGAIEDMYVRLRAAAAAGVAVLLVSTELEEVMAVASRIAVISSGAIAGVLTADEATSERLGLLVGGVAA
jgi:simple sugar transport system ATP-binding protein